MYLQGLNKANQACLSALEVWKWWKEGLKFMIRDGFPKEKEKETKAREIS